MVDPEVQGRAEAVRRPQHQRGGITNRATRAKGRQTARGRAVAALSEPEGQSHRDLAGDGPGEGSAT